MVTNEETSSKPEAPPHVYIAMAVIKKFLEYTPKESSSHHDQCAVDLQSFLQALEAADTTTAIGLIIPFLKINKTYNEICRLAIAGLVFLE